MQVYDQNKSKIEDYNKRTTILNNPNNDDRVFKCFFIDVTPTWLKVVFFLTGLIGLNVIATIVSLLLTTLNLSSAQLSLWGNFIPYLLIFITFISLMFTIKRKGKLLGVTFLKEFKSWKTYAFGFGCFALTYLINIIFSLSYANIPGYGANLNQSSLESMIKGNSPAYLVLFFLEIVIFAPFIEELTYRVGLCGLCSGKKHNYILGIIISSIVFGLIHFNALNIQSYKLLVNALDIENCPINDACYNDMLNYLNSINQTLGFTNDLSNISLTAARDLVINNINIAIRNEWLNLPVYILSGALLATSFCYSGKLSSSFLSHSVNNLISFILMVV